MKRIKRCEVVLIVILLLAIAIPAFAEAPIGERIDARILSEKAITDTAKVKIVEEEIQKDVIVVSVIVVSVIEIPITEVSDSSRKLRKAVQHNIANTNFKKYLREGNTAMAQNCLQALEVDNDVIKTLITGLGKEVPIVKINDFREYKMCRSQTYEGESDENAYVVSDYDMIVKVGDLAIFNITKWSDAIRVVEFMKKNKDKLSAVIIGWGNKGENNFYALDFSKYEGIMKNHEDFFSICKAIKPDLPVGICVAYKDNTMRQWLKACPFNYDFLAVFNINKLGANFEKIQDRFPNQKLMIGGMNAFDDLSLKQEYGGTAYVNYIKELTELGYCGSIWIK